MDVFHNNSVAEVAAKETGKVAQMSAPKVERRRETATAKRHEIPALWRVLSKARQVFDMQINKTDQTKTECIRHFMSMAYVDENLFWMDFMAQVNLLLDSRKFCRECLRFGYKPENVAEHVVFLGSGPMRKVLRDGVSHTLGAKIQNYKERFSPEQANNYRDSVEDMPAAAKPVEDDAA